MENPKAMWRSVGAVVCWLALLALTGCMLLQPRNAVDFEASRMSGWAPQLVDFTPTLEGDAAGYEWDFGDGATSTEATPSHIYRQAGTFTVSLAVEFADGETVETVKVDLITVSWAPQASGEGGLLYWMDRTAGTISSGAPNGAMSTTVVTGIYRGKHIAVGNGRIFWTADWTVECANLDGTGREALYRDGAMLPIGIAVDSTTEKVYWVEPPAMLGHSARIWKANLDGSNAKIYAGKPEWSSNSYGPWLLAVDSKGGKLYWYEMNHPYEGPILPVSLSEPLDWTPKASLHWTPVNGFFDHEIASELPKTKAIALDVGLPEGARYVYWTDPSNDRVLRAKYDQPILMLGPLVYVCLLADSPNALAIDAHDGKIYWSESDGIHRADLSNTSDEELIFPGVRADSLALDL